MPNLQLKIWTNQSPPFKVTWPEWRPLIGQNFWLQIWHIWAILRLIYPWSNFDPGVISIFFSPKTYYSGPIDQFYFWCFKGNVHKGWIWKQNFQIEWKQKVTESNFENLKCSYLIGGGSDFYLQYDPATVLSIAFRNGMTLENLPKNAGVRAKSLIWWYF